MFYTEEQRDSPSEGDSPLATERNHPKEAVGSVISYLLSAQVGSSITRVPHRSRLSMPPFATPHLCDNEDSIPAAEELLGIHTQTRFNTNYSTFHRGDMSYGSHLWNPSEGCASELSTEHGGEGREAVDGGNSPQLVRGWRLQHQVSREREAPR